VQEQTRSSKTPQADLIYLRLAQNTEQTRQELKAFEHRRDEATLAPVITLRKNQQHSDPASPPQQINLSRTNQSQQQIPP
jgi:hypothetical protein